MHTTRHSPSPQESLHECLPRSLIQRQVWLDLPNLGDLGDALQLPTDLASFLKQSEDAINEGGDAQHPHAPLATGPPMLPKRESDQQHPTTAGEARSKSGTAPSTRPAAAGGAKPKCHTMLDPVKCPKEWVRAYAGKMKEPPGWWLEFCFLYQGCTGWAPQDLCAGASPETGCRLQTSHSPS